MANPTIKIRQTLGGMFRGTSDEWHGVLSTGLTPTDAYNDALRQLVDYRWAQRSNVKETSE